MFKSQSGVTLPQHHVKRIMWREYFKTQQGGGVYANLYQAIY